MSDRVPRSRRVESDNLMIVLLWFYLVAVIILEDLDRITVLIYSGVVGWHTIYW